jgi:hypothetical protein
MPDDDWIVVGATLDGDLYEPEGTYDDEVAEWWAWHMAEAREPYGTEGPPLRATITVDPGDYL